MDRVHDIIREPPVLDIIKQDQRKRHFHFDIPEGTRLTSLGDFPRLYLDPDLA